MLVAVLYRIPTVNGMASFRPQGWDLGDPFLPDYETRAMGYAARYGIADGLYALSFKPVTWSRRNFRTLYHFLRNRCRFRFLLSPKAQSRRDQ
jgi:hypothetical protein